MLYSFFKSLVLPPASAYVLLLAAWLVGWRWRWVGQFLLLAVILSLWALSTSFVSSHLTAPLQKAALLSAAAAAEGDVIVVLAGGTTGYRDPGPVVRPDGLTLERMLEAARLHRLTGLPIVATGGPSPLGPASGDLMAATFRDMFAIDAVVSEPLAENTLGSAHRVAALLRAHGWQRPLVVTHGWHLPRTMLAFASTEVDAIPAPASRISVVPLTLTSLRPTASALEQSYYALYERIGLLWYRLRLNGPQASSKNLAGAPVRSGGGDGGPSG